MEELYVSAAIATLLSFIKNPGRRKKLKSALIKVRDVLISYDLENM
jgi:hypothetical protein